MVENGQQAPSSALLSVRIYRIGDSRFSALSVRDVSGANVRARELRVAGRPGAVTHFGRLSGWMFQAGKATEKFRDL
jgi:hypothetical protein